MPYETVSIEHCESQESTPLRRGERAQAFTKTRGQRGIKRALEVAVKHEASERCEKDHPTLEFRQPPFQQDVVA
ncbi:hypothetical protein [Rhizobium leguminosarum]|uniref:hypothetical protein n=1 Tax=Rhizobium leguminosarum TaxID=384 RepID=UPI003F9A3323